MSASCCRGPARGGSAYDGYLARHRRSRAVRAAALESRRLSGDIPGLSRRARSLRQHGRGRGDPSGCGVHPGAGILVAARPREKALTREGAWRRPSFAECCRHATARTSRLVLCRAPRAWSRAQPGELSRPLRAGPSPTCSTRSRPRAALAPRRCDSQRAGLRRGCSRPPTGTACVEPRRSAGPSWPWWCASSASCDVNAFVIRSCRHRRGFDLITARAVSEGMSTAAMAAGGWRRMKAVLWSTAGDEAELQDCRLDVLSSPCPARARSLVHSDHVSRETPTAGW